MVPPNRTTPKGATNPGFPKSPTKVEISQSDVSKSTEQLKYSGPKVIDIKTIDKRPVFLSKVIHFDDKTQLYIMLNQTTGIENIFYCQPTPKDGLDIEGFELEKGLVSHYKHVRGTITEALHASGSTAGNSIDAQRNTAKTLQTLMQGCTEELEDFNLAGIREYK